MEGPAGTQRGPRRVAQGRSRTPGCKLASASGSCPSGGALPAFPPKCLPVPGVGADTRSALRVLGHRGGLGTRLLAEKEGGKEERAPRASLTVPECDDVEYDAPSDSPN